MPNRLVDLEVEEVSGVDQPAIRRKFLVIKRAEDDVAERNEPDVTAKLSALEDAVSDEKLDERVKKNVWAQLKALFKSEEQDEPDQVTALEKRQAEKIQALEQRLEKAERERSRERFLKLAANLVGPELADDFGSVFEDAATGMESANFEKLTKLVGTLVKVQEQSVLFKELGVNTDAPADPEDKLDQLAKARAKEQGEDYAIAYSEVLKTDEGAALYHEYRAAQRGR